ncbi:MAG: hypothetical protein AB1461_04245 [Thermodesulfobacteriota bacterium]
MFVTLPGAAVADDQDQDRFQDRLKDKLQDGSCQHSTDASGRFDLAADRDRVKDGDCDGDGPDQDRDGWDYSTDLSGRFTLAGDNGNGAGDQERIRDPDSCLDGGYSTDSINMILAGRQRDKDNVKDKLKDCKGNG